MTTATTTATTTGTIDWSRRTGGHLAAAERRRLVADVARVLVRHAVGRLSLFAHLNPGRNAYVPPAQLVPPDSPLTRAATEAATRVLPVTLLNHSYRAYRFGRALGELEKIDVDAELLFAAALLHDTGLVVASGRDDFTLTSARVAGDVAEQAGLSRTATETVQTAITMHHSPGVTRAAGPVAYLLSAGAGADVVGMRCWDLPPAMVADAVRDHPREGFKAFFRKAWANEAARVPGGRAQLLRRYGAFTAAIALAPFDE
jgi:HD domain